MQIDPDSTEGYTSGPELGTTEPNFSVADLTGLNDDQVLGKAVFDRTVAPSEASPWGRQTDSWLWLDASAAWPDSGFRLRISTNPTVAAITGDYAIWPDAPFVPTSDEPPAVARYRIVRVDAEDARATVGELLVEAEGGRWRQTWWSEGSMLQQDRIHLAADVDYRFEPLSGPSTLNTNDLRICACALTDLRTVVV